MLPFLAMTATRTMIVVITLILTRPSLAYATIVPAIPNQDHGNAHDLDLDLDHYLDLDHGHDCDHDHDHVRGHDRDTSMTVAMTVAMAMTVTMAMSLRWSPRCLCR